MWLITCWVMVGTVMGLRLHGPESGSHSPDTQVLGPDRLPGSGAPPRLAVTPQAIPQKPSQGGGEPPSMTPLPAVDCQAK